MHRLGFALFLLCAGCGSRSGLIVELDDGGAAAPDAGREMDAGRDAGLDAGADAGPRRDAGPLRPSTLTSGTWFGCGADSEGTLQCWGNNHSGQLGDGTRENSSVPVEVVNGLENELAQLAGGGGFVCGLDFGGDVWCWGDRIGRYRLPPDGSPAQVEGVHDVVQIAASLASACALHADGGVSCWGTEYEQRGSACDARAERRPSRVPGAERAVQVEVGNGSHCIRRDDGTVACWGCNAHGKLGIGERPGVFEEPVTLEGLRDVVDLSLGWDHGCAVQADGRSFCWGSATAGALGNGLTRGNQPTPEPTNLPRATRIFAGDWATTCALVGDGEVRCVGSIPRMSPPGGCSGSTDSAWRRIDGLPPIERMSISFGFDFCARAREDRSVWCWGCNAFGGVGDGTGTLTEEPALILR